MKDIVLLPHNQDMVERIEKEMVFGNHKIFFSEATGLGKSFIFMYLVLKYFNDKKVLYICPKKHIWYNMQQYKEFELIKDSVTMMCNANFNTIKEEHFGYDAIFIDEAHHLKTNIQGNNILQIAESTISTNSNAFVYGFTATPYVDGEMIGDLYFDTSVMGMDYPEAVENGLLKEITVAAAVAEKISLTEEELENARKIFTVDSTSNTVRSLVNEYSNVNHWLVYFTKIDELNDNIQYFEKDFSEFKLFIIHSEIEDNEDVLREFESYEGKAMLVSVSMVLEGIHPKTVEGILLYRNVHSTNTLIQIMGRLGVMNMSMNPIVIDIYNSYEIFMKSTMIKEILNNGNRTSTDYSYKDCIVLHSNTYKFIDFINYIYEIRNNKNVKEYRGITWTNDVELSLKLGKGKTYISQYICKGKTYEEIIDYVLDGIKEYRGITWTSDMDLSRKLGKNMNYVNMYIHDGKTYEEIIDMVLDFKPNEYRGITWTNDRELSLKLGKNDGYVGLMRGRRGKTYEELIDRVLDDNTQEYRGITWTNDRELSKKIGKSIDYVSSAINRYGKTYEELIDKFLDGNTQEYRGIIWTSDLDLSRTLGKYDLFVHFYHVKKGKTYEEIIDMVLDFKPNEYRGITWTSDMDLSRKLGKSNRYVNKYIREGKTYEEIIDFVLDYNKK